MDKQQIYEIIVRNLPLGFSIVDEKGTIIDANDAVEKITGYNKTELIGRSHQEIFHGTSDEKSCPLLSRALRDRETVVADEMTVKNRYGEIITVSVTAAPLFDEKGAFIGGVELFRDITGIKQLQRERKNILSMFAHDMKNPVMTAVGFLTRLISGKTEHERSDLLLIRDELKTVESLIADFLQYSRFEAKEYQPVLKPFAVDVLLRKQVENARIMANEKNIKIQTEFPEDAFPAVNADEAMIERVITNLVDNAIKYTNSGGEISIRLLNRDKDILVQVQDTGIGIPSDKLTCVFDAFFRVSRDQKGSGLGLSIAKTIVEAHGGKIWTESTPGKGSIFSFTLPK